MTAIVILAAIGIVAILAELLLPGGILGIAGMLCLLGAVVMTFVEYGPTAGTGAVVLLFLFGFATLGWWMKFFHKLPVTRNLILHDASGEREAKEEDSLVGKKGTALTDLMPSGRALVDGKKLDVMSESGAVRKDALLEVVAVRGPSVFVRELDDSGEA